MIWRVVVRKTYEIIVTADHRDAAELTALEKVDGRGTGQVLVVQTVREVAHSAALQEAAQ